ncbi:MAG: BatA domain-containing protein [Spirosomataceae bacterium]
MELLNPMMLWGALAVSIPILLHFWHQKKGKVIEWAAMQWLIEKDLQQSKGIRLDNILLLILRCLLVLILALILSEPILNWLNNSDLSTKVHLVEANQLVTENFRFELEAAQKKGEKIYWINPNAEPADDFKQIPQIKDFDAFILQSCINKVGQNVDNEQFELYFVNSPKLSQLANIFVPNNFKVHPVIDSTTQSKPFFKISDNKFLVVNADNQLVVSETIDAKKYPNIAHEGELKFLFLTNNESQKKSFEAALKAINEVYGILYSVDFQQDRSKKYDLVFDAKSFESDSRSEAEIVTETIVKKFNLNPDNQPLSNQQLSALFKTEKQFRNHAQTWLNDSLFAVFLLVLGIERWLSVRRNA